MPESLKNVLLVMSSSGYLVPKSQDETQEKLWTETWKRIDRFLPDLREEIDLEGPGVEENVKGGVIPTTASNSEAEQVQSEIRA